MNGIFAASAVLCALESKAQPFIADALEKALGPRALQPMPLVLPAAYAAVVFVNVFAASFAVMSLGMAVGKARKKYGIEYPTMYAEGKSAKANAFNCVQRGHQQALETLPIFLAVSLLGGLRHPYLVALSGVAWIIGRIRWATCYAEAGAEGRYGSFWSKFIWYSLIANAVATVSFAAGIAGIF